MRHHQVLICFPHEEAVELTHSYRNPLHPSCDDFCSRRAILQMRLHQSEHGVARHGFANVREGQLKQRQSTHPKTTSLASQAICRNRTQDTCGSGKTTVSAVEDFKSSKRETVEPRQAVWLWGASKHSSDRATSAPILFSTSADAMWAVCPGHHRRIGNSAYWWGRQPKKPKPPQKAQGPKTPTTNVGRVSSVLR